ncbi:MAG: DUF2167 domain-containing protein [Candidatus Thiodiazotropha sp. (ex Semelilucina semeliformis)]|nr:DUF2167 domain-containing protein [Candidatus Thiodiazotropha sp. (ex Semelilucina semeliformis)]
MRNPLTLLLFTIIGFSQPALCNDQQMTPEEVEYLIAAEKIWNSLDRKKGEIKMPNGVATLQVPDSFYYLKPQDTETVLVEIWGNPPDAGMETLGMLMPDESTPFDDGSWGVTIEYEDEGYVSDEDADAIDYADLLADMQEGTQEASKQRVAQGYEPIELVGWASTPFYDKSSHKLHWAKEIRFGDDPVHTLNYNIRVLGRQGVLLLNFIAGMDQKEKIDAEIGTVLALAEFNQGSRYEDFNPELDKVAAYGIGALVAGKVVAKTGLLAAALIFLKKFGVFILIGLGAVFGKLFKRKSENSE